MTQDQKKMLLFYDALSKSYNGFVDELNNAIVKKELTEAERVRVAAIRVRMDIVGQQVKSVLLALQDMGLIAKVSWQPENILPTLCDLRQINRN